MLQDLLARYHELFELAGVEMDAALTSVVDLCTFFVVLCFVASVMTENYSQVDKLWSITPW